MWKILKTQWNVVWFIPFGLPSVKITSLFYEIIVFIITQKTYFISCLHKWCHFPPLSSTQCHLHQHISSVISINVVIFLLSSEQYPVSSCIYFRFFFSSLVFIFCSGGLTPSTYRHIVENAVSFRRDATDDVCDHSYVHIVNNTDRQSISKYAIDTI